MFHDPQTDDDLLFLMKYDSDSFNRWDAGNRYFTSLVLSMVEKGIDNVSIPSKFIDAIKTILLDSKVSLSSPNNSNI